LSALFNICYGSPYQTETNIAPLNLGEKIRSIFSLAAFSTVFSENKSLISTMNLANPIISQRSSAPIVQQVTYQFQLLLENILIDAV